MKQFYGEELDRELSDIEKEIHNLVENANSIRSLVESDSILYSDVQITGSIESGMKNVDSIRTLLLNYKKDGRSCKATLYNDVLNKFIESVQSLELSMEEYEKELEAAFNSPEQVMSVRQIGDAHYLFRENALEKFGYGNEEQRLEKLEALHTSIAQLKAILVGLEFLAYSSDKCET